MKTIFSIAFVAAILLSILFVGVQLSGTQLPPAPTVTTEQLQLLQARSKIGEQFVIVDVRDKTETDVSIIPGAMTLAEFENTKQQHRNKTIITYCTIGYRSGIYAQKLNAIGWNAWNYKGSILAWCKHHLPVVTPSGQNTTRVHTYNCDYALAAGYQPVC